jgi:protocatechuate 3,4-dioxygenase beta subunit
MNRNEFLRAVGPYPLDLTSDLSMFRRDITEGRPGLPLRVELAVVNVNDACKPVSNARIDVWHTDKEGVYSGYAQPGANTVGQTFMRGIQITDTDGRASFDTIYPGWYGGRITHIHYQVYLNSVLYCHERDRRIPPGKSDDRAISTEDREHEGVVVERSMTALCDWRPIF